MATTMTQEQRSERRVRGVRRLRSSATSGYRERGMRRARGTSFPAAHRGPGRRADGAPVVKSRSAKLTGNSAVRNTDLGIQGAAGVSDGVETWPDTTEPASVHARRGQ